jgi:hypothetical protein
LAFARFYLLNANQQFFYKILKTAIIKHSSQIDIMGLNVNDVNCVIHAVLVDNPIFFWFEGKWKLEENRGIRYLVPQYTFGISDTNEICRQLDELCYKFYKQTSNSYMYDKIRITYDWLLENTKYDMSERNGQTIYDSLINRKAVCKGVSKGFQYLLSQINCFSTVREGTLDGKAKHAWNIVEYNDRYYNVDVTMGYNEFKYLFDDIEKDNKYKCFMVSDDKLMKTHVIYDLNKLGISCDIDYRGGMSVGREIYS